MDELLARLQRAVTGRYRIEQELGRGGMAVVFLGHDLRHERRVAIKVFEKDTGLISAAERFLREIRIAARLQHPNILPVFDSGEGEDLVYYVMPYVTGGSVRERLEREGPLPVSDALRIGREVAEALDHAHRAGIVHRDIKPDNIMLADGAAVVADFGIARALEEGGAKVTDTGLAIGTPTYMSPEQAAASPHLDGRTDIYSLGCVLYEMLAGTPPFAGTSGQAVMARHATDQVPPLRTVRELPPVLEGVVLKALAKTPADRWPTGRAMAEGLAAVGTVSTVTATVPPRSRRLHWSVPTGVALVAVVALLWSTLSGPSRSTVAATGSDSLPKIAVLPFDISGDSAQSHIASGVTEAVINALMRVGIPVPDQTTVARYSGRVQDPQAIGRELRVDQLLIGNVLVAGDSLRVTPRLVRVSDGYIVWREYYDGNKANIFAMQDNITRRMIGALQVVLTPQRQSALARGVGTTNQEAYTLYMLGRSMYARADGKSLRRSIDYFNQAAAKDSTYAAPLVGLRDAYDLLENVEPGQYQIVGPGTSELVRRAMQLDPGSGEVRMHSALLRWRACDDAGTEREFQESIRLSPGSSEIRRNYSIFLTNFGRFPEALAAIREAAKIDPTSPWVLAVLAHVYSLVEQHDSALAVSERALALDSTHWVSHAVRGTALALAGRAKDGIVPLETARRLGGESHGLTTGLLGWTYAQAGRRQGAERMAQLLARRAERGEATRWHVAYVYAGLGEHEKAFEWLAKPPQRTDWKAADNGFWQPMLEPLRSDPRFSELAKRRWCQPDA